MPWLSTYTHYKALNSRIIAVNTSLKQNLHGHWGAVMNLKHLFYFWKVATCGGVARASEAIHMTPQTLSTQIKLLEDALGTSLFSRVGRSLELTDAGRLSLGYADAIFALDAELEQALHEYPKTKPLEFRVGVSDVLPKALAYRLLRPALAMTIPIKIICREWRLDRLMAELAVHHLDLVITDTVVPPALKMRIYHDQLAKSGITFLASPELVRKAAAPFPGCLDTLPLLVPSDDSAAGRETKAWLAKNRLHPVFVGEFDDTALMAEFAREGAGAFPVPTMIQGEYLAGGKLEVLGHAVDIRIEYFALSVNRKQPHPCVSAVITEFSEAAM